MSTLDINSIRDYLIEVGCKVEYPILVNAFKKYLYNPDPNIQSTVRTQFKDYVNRLSTVNVENNMKFITLRPEFRPPGHPLSSPQNGQAKSDYFSQQKQPPPQAQSPPPPPLPPPMMTSSPKRSPPGQHVPTTISLNQQQPSVADHNHHHHQLLTQNHNTQSHAKNDRLDSPRIVSATSKHQQQQQQQMQSSDPMQPVQSRRQHQQSAPRPPPVPQHRKLSPVSAERDTAPPQSPITSLASRPPRPAETDRHNSPQYISPANQQLNHHYRSQSQPVPRQLQPPVQQSHQPPHPQQQVNNNNNNSNKDHAPSPVSIAASVADATLMPPPPAPLQHQQQQRRHQSPLSRQSSSLQKLDNMPPPRPPPRRRQSTASLYKPSPNKSIDKSSSRDMQELARKSLAGRISRDPHHAAQRSYSSASTNDLSPFMAKRNSSMKENHHRLSRDSNLGNLSSSFQSISFNRIKRSRSSHRGEDESDSSSLQPNDPLRRKWTIEASSCNYNSLLQLLREDSKLAFCKDIMNGYTALHWAAKFGNLEIIRLIAGTYGVSVNIKSSAGQTPLHVAYMFNRLEAVNLLLQNYQASTEVRDHSGRRPMQYWQKPNATNTR